MSIDATGHVTIVPVAGVTGGDYAVRLHAASTSRPDLRAEATVLVTVEPPGAARVDVEVALISPGASRWVTPSPRASIASPSSTPA